MLFTYSNNLILGRLFAMSVLNHIIFKNEYINYIYIFYINSTICLNIKSIWTFSRNNRLKKSSYFVFYWSEEIRHLTCCLSSHKKASPYCRRKSQITEFMEFFCLSRTGVRHARTWHFVKQTCCKLHSKLCFLPSSCWKKNSDKNCTMKIFIQWIVIISENFKMISDFGLETKILNERDRKEEEYLYIKTIFPLFDKNCLWTS